MVEITNKILKDQTIMKISGRRISNNEDLKVDLVDPLPPEQEIINVIKDESPNTKSK
jgi:hypothetical protein